MNALEDAALALVHEFIGGASSLRDALVGLAEIATPGVGADMAGLTLLTVDGRPTTVAHTDGMVAELDQAQYDADRGPCLHAFRDRRIVHVADTATEPRWPEFGAVAASNGISTSLSVPIIVGAQGVGAFNFYGRVEGTFGDSAAGIGTLYARLVATVAAYYDRAEEADNLQRAIQTRAEIEQAKGVLMASTGCSAEDAFDLLRQQSQAENRKLRDIAAEIVAQQRRTD